jgi:glycosyltransferase involved in cell wall biosynthesis
MRDVLFLSYFFPPMGGGAVLRALKFVKYLPAFGWRPLVVAGAARYHLYDEQLLAEVPADTVVRRVAPRRFWGGGRARGDASVPAPGSRRFLARAGRRLSREFRRVLSFPDLYAPFAGPAYDEARNLIDEFDVRLIFSTAPPYTSHLVGERLARETGLPLVLDYRDAWAGNPFDRPPTPFHRWRTPRAEAAVLERAAAAVAVTAGMAETYRGRLPAGRPVAFIPNGYDEADFDGDAPTSPGPFTVSYTGQFYGGRMPWTFLAAAGNFVASRNLGPDDFRVRLVGPIGQALTGRAETYGVAISAEGAAGHGHAVDVMRSADANLLVIGSRPGAGATLTGKIFEYLRAGRPILALVPPDGEAAALVREFDAGRVVPPDDVAAAEAALAELYDARPASAAAPTPPAGVERFERRRLTGELAALYDDVAGR